MDHNKRWLSKKKWTLITGLVFTLFISVFLITDINVIIGNYTQAYMDQSVYQLAIKKTEAHPRVKETLGDLEPLNRMTVMNGAVHYSQNNDTIYSIIKITGTHKKAMLDIIAYRNGSQQWHFENLMVRIKNPVAFKETIDVLN